MESEKPTVANPIPSIGPESTPKRIQLGVSSSFEQGYKVHVAFLDHMDALDAVAAIRGLVDRTAEVTGWSAEKILGLVEKQVIAFDAALPRIRA